MEEITCGIDWSERHHDVALMNGTGAGVGRLKIDTGVSGFGELMSLLAEHGGDPKSVPVAIETDKNLLVAAMQAAGMTVYAINPRAVARYRDRHSQAGKKSAILANILRTDREMHRPLPAITEAGLAIKALARQHQEAIWALHQTNSQLRSVLLVSSILKHCKPSHIHLLHRGVSLPAKITGGSAGEVSRPGWVRAGPRTGDRRDPGGECQGGGQAIDGQRLQASA